MYDLINDPLSASHRRIQYTSKLVAIGSVEGWIHPGQVVQMSKSKQTITVIIISSVLTILTCTSHNQMIQHCYMNYELDQFLQHWCIFNRHHIHGSDLLGHSKSSHKEKIHVIINWLLLIGSQYVV